MTESPEIPTRSEDVTPQRHVDPQHFRHVMGHYPTGVTIVTSRGTDGAPVGLAVGSFGSVSLDPPLVAFYAMKGSRSFDEIQSHGAFVANILGSRRDYYCRAFSREREHRFTGIDWTPSESGAPVLAVASVWVECIIERVEEAGDHFWVLGRVEALDVGTGDQPLVFYKGGFGKPVGLLDPRVRWGGDPIGDL